MTVSFVLGTFAGLTSFATSSLSENLGGSASAAAFGETAPRRNRSLQPILIGLQSFELFVEALGDDCFGRWNRQFEITTLGFDFSKMRGDRRNSNRALNHQKGEDYQDDQQQLGGYASANQKPAEKYFDRARLRIFVAEKPIGR